VKAGGSDDFEGLKRLIHENKGVPVEWQSLYYAQKELAAGQTLASCGIKRESTLHLHMHMIRPCLVVVVKPRWSDCRAFSASRSRYLDKLEHRSLSKYLRTLEFSIFLFMAFYSLTPSSKFASRVDGRVLPVPASILDMQTHVLAVLAFWYLCRAEIS
jgi:hypothetical protein